MKWSSLGIIPTNWNRTLLFSHLPISNRRCKWSKILLGATMAMKTFPVWLTMSKKTAFRWSSRWKLICWLKLSDNFRFLLLIGFYCFQQLSGFCIAYCQVGGSLYYRTIASLIGLITNANGFFLYAESYKSRYRSGKSELVNWNLEPKINVDLTSHPTIWLLVEANQLSNNLL